MILVLIGMAVVVLATPAVPCALGSGKNGYNAALLAPPTVVAPPPKPVITAKPRPKPLVAPPKKKLSRLSLGCSSHKKG